MASECTKKTGKECSFFKLLNEWQQRGKRGVQHTLLVRALSLSQEVMLQLDRTLLMLHLDYCMQCWSQRNDVEVLQRVQRWFARLMPGRGGISHRERLNRKVVFSGWGTSVSCEEMEAVMGGGGEQEDLQQEYIEICRCPIFCQL